MTEKLDLARLRVLVLGDAGPTGEAETEADLIEADLLEADLGRAIDAAAAEAPCIADTQTLAALVEGGLDPQEASALLRHPADRARAEAAAAFLEAVHAESAEPPSHLLAAARDGLAGGAEVVPLRRRPAALLPATEAFHLLAAATLSEDQAVLCHSESGLWTLQTFPGISAADRADGRCSLLVTVNPEHAAVYEGLVLRAFVVIGGVERVLAEDVVRDGAVFAEISLAGLDLRNRDAVSVVFSAPPSD